jgi:hypothetical protein
MHRETAVMWSIRNRQRPDRKRPRVRPNIEALDDRIVPATMPFDPRALAARGAAELAMGLRRSESLAAFNNLTRLNNTLDRLNNQFTTRLNQFSNRFTSQISTLNNQVAARAQVISNLFPEFAANFGSFDPATGQFTKQAAQRFNNQLNRQLRAQFGNSVVTTSQGPFSTGGFDDTAFANRVNANLQRLGTQLNRQLGQFSRQLGAQVNRFTTSFAGSSPTFGTAARTIGSNFITTIADFRTSLRTGLNVAGVNLSAGTTGFNNTFQDAISRVSPAASLDADLLQELFGNEFGMFTKSSITNVDDFTSSFNTSFDTFTSGLDTGLGDFFNSLNTQFFTPGPGFGATPTTPTTPGTTTGGGTPTPIF